MKKKGVELIAWKHIKINIGMGEKIKMTKISCSLKIKIENCVKLAHHTGNTQERCTGTSICSINNKVPYNIAIHIKGGKIFERNE